MKPSIKFSPRIFASADWNLWVLRTVATLSIAFAIGWKWPPFETFNFKFGLILQILLGTIGSLIALHLITTVYYRRNSGIRFLALNIHYLLLSISLPISILLATHHQKWVLHFDGINPTQYFENENSFELAITQQTNLPKNKVWVIKWEDLKVNTIIRHEAWPFTVTPKVLIQSASFGIENSKKIDKHGQHIAGIGATDGYAVDQNLRLFSATKTKDPSLPGGLFKIESIGGNKETSYLLAPEIPTEAIASTESMSPPTSSFSIQLRKRRFYPGFSMALQSTNSNSLPLLTIFRDKKQLHSEKFGFLKPVHFHGFTFTLHPSGLINNSGTFCASKPYGPTWFFILFSLVMISGIIHSIVELHRIQKDPSR